MAAFLINGRYRRAAELGAGATSRVWLVHDELEHVDLALKLFAEDLREAAAHEFETLRALVHPGIAQARECGIDWETGSFFFTSEVVSGRDFVTAARSLATDDQLLLFVHVLRVLQFLHSRGIVHRDIKPANLLVTDAMDRGTLAERCPVRLIDFGLARSTSDCSEQGGSLPYMAPEMFEGSPANVQTDLYAFGVVMFEVLAGERLITGSTQLEMIRAHRDVADRLSAISSPFERVLAALLARDPKARPRSAREALLELSRLSPMEIPPETLETMLARVHSSFRSPMPVAVAKPLGPAGGALVITYPSGDEPCELMSQVEALACLAERVPITWSVAVTDPILHGLRSQLSAMQLPAVSAGDLWPTLRRMAERRPIALVIAPHRDGDLLELEQLLSRWPPDPRMALVVLLEESRSVVTLSCPQARVASLTRDDLIAGFIMATGVPPKDELLRHLGNQSLGAGQVRRALSSLFTAHALELNDAELVFFAERASTLAPPMGEQERVAQLVGQLSPRARELLAMLAVAEHSTPQLDLDDAQVVSELLTSGLLLERDDAGAAMQSPSVRECVLLCLSDEQRRRAHAAVAERLVASSSGDPRADAERGFHLARSGDMESAFPALAAGARALIAAFEIELARRPIELLRELSAQRNEGRWQFHASWLEGERCLRAGEPAAAIEWLQKALASRPSTESPSAIQATLAKAFERIGDYARALKCLDEASRERDLAPEVKARLMIDRAFILYRQGCYDEAREMCLGAGRLLKGHDLQRIRFGNLMGLICRQQGMLHDAETYLQAAVADARAIAMPAFEAQALNSMANVEFAQGKVRRAIEVLGEAARVLHEHGEKQQLHTLVHFNIASYALVLGDLELAREKLQLMRGFLEEQPDESAWSSYEFQLARLAYLEGDLQQAETLAMSCAVRQQRIGERAGLCDTLSFAARWSARSGDVARAHDLLEQARAAATDAAPNSRAFLLAATLEIALQAGGSADERLAQDLNDVLLRADPVLALIENEVLVRFHLARERRQVASALAARMADRCAALGLDHLEAGYHALVAICGTDLGGDGESRFEVALAKLGERAASRRVLAPLCMEYARRLLTAFRTAPLDARERVQKLERARQLAARAADVFRLIGDSLGVGQSQALLAELAALETDSLGRGDVARRMRNLERLKNITKAISEEADDERLLRLIIDQAVELADGRRGFLILLKGNSLEVRVARNLADQDIHHPEFTVSHSVAMRVARTGEPLLISNATEDMRFRESSSISRLHLLSIICVPLRVQDKVIGSLYVDHPSAVDHFDSLHLEVLTDLSDHAAIALEKARLLSENQERARALSASKREIERLNWELNQTVAEQERELVEVKQTLEKYRKDRGLKYEYASIITQSARMGDILRLLDRISESNNPVLITGESGTGKELVARAIHDNGLRAKRAFVSLNCAAVPEPLIESELFGYVRGAFTGADRDKAGVFELADRGTLFLDEIGDMSLEVQKRLLRVLQSGEFMRLGAKENRKVDVRIVGATNRSLKDMVQTHLFREDLYYRLAVHLVDLPPLRERRDDVPLLVAHFVEKHSAEAAPGTPRKRVTAEAMEALQRYRWGGNVRELENEVRRLLAMTAGKPSIERDDLPDAIATFSGPDAEAPFAGTLREVVDRFERDQIVRALAACSGNKAAAARLLGMSTRNLFKKVEKYGLA